METGEGNLMEISECSSPCLLKVSLLNSLSAGWLLVIHSETGRQRNTREWVYALEEIKIVGGRFVSFKWKT